MLMDKEIFKIETTVRSHVEFQHIEIVDPDYVIAFARAIEAKVRKETTQSKQCPRCEGPNGPLDVEDGYTITMDDCDMFVTRCGLCERVLRRSKNLFVEEEA